MYEYKAAIHVHRRFSDGAGHPKEILKAAKEAGLDVIIISDHNNLRCLEYEGWHDTLLCLVGEEVSPNRSHYLALNIKEKISHNGKVPQGTIDEVIRRGGFGFIAHPDFRGKWFPPLPRRTWDHWEVTGFCGMEIWTYACALIEAVDWRQPSTWLGDRSLRIKGPNPLTLRRWDSLLQQGKVVGLGTLDAHGGKLFRVLPTNIMPYGEAFRTVRTHLILPVSFKGNASMDAFLVYEALQWGHCFFANDAVADSTGFRFEAANGEGNCCMGDSLAWKSRYTFLEVRSPESCWIRVMLNGQVLLECQDKELTLAADSPGVYRVEASLDDIPWLYSNAIHLTQEELT